MLFALLGCLSAGLTLPASAPSVTTNDLQQRAVRQAAGSELREVIENCTHNLNDSDSVIIDCLLPEFQRSGMCSPLPACTPKALPDLVTQYHNMDYGITTEKQPFTLSEIPAANDEGIQYVGFPNRAFILTGLRRIVANSSCFARSYEPVNLGENYFPSVLLVVSECTVRQSCVNCQSRREEPSLDQIAVLRRVEGECEEDGTEKWETWPLRSSDLPQDDINRQFYLACSCESH